MVEGLTTSAADQWAAARDLGSHLVAGTGRRGQNAKIPIDSSAARGRMVPVASQPVTSSQQKNPGDSSGEATPVPIPNTEVKLSSAEDTEMAAFRENRSSPGFLRSRGMTGSSTMPAGRPRRERRGTRLSFGP